MEIISKEELRRRCHIWYYNEDEVKREAIWWELLKEVRYHSIDFIGRTKPRRFRNIGNMKYLIGEIQKRFMNPDKDPFWHFFKSRAYIRKTIENRPAKIKKEFYQLIFGWDAVKDVDAKDNFDLAKRIALKFNRGFKKLEIPFVRNFSGYKGFHTSILWEDLRKYFSESDWGEESSKFSNFVLDKMKLTEEEEDTIDWGVLNASGMAIIRVRWSLHPETGLICLPLTEKELEKFTPEYANPENYLELVKPHMGIKKTKGDLSKLMKLYGKEIVPGETTTYDEVWQCKNCRTVNIINSKECKSCRRVFVENAGSP